MFALLAFVAFFIEALPMAEEVPWIAIGLALLALHFVVTINIVPGVTWRRGPE